MAKLDKGMSKEWEPIHAYERRLSSKDKCSCNRPLLHAATNYGSAIIVTKPKRPAKSKKSGGTLFDADGAGADGAASEHGTDREAGIKSKSSRKPRKSRSKNKKTTESYDYDEADYTVAGTAQGVHASALKPRRSGRTSNGKNAVWETDTDGVTSTGVSEVEDVLDTDGATVPNWYEGSSRKKRGREESGDEVLHITGSPHSPASVSAFRSRRKRVREEL